MNHANGRRAAVIAVVASTVLSAGCSGGSQSGPSAVAMPSNAPSRSASKDKVTFHLDAPKVAAAIRGRKPQYISPATTQVSVDIEQNGSSISGYPMTVALTPTSTGCTSTLTTTDCTLTFDLAPGSYTVSLTAEDGNGNALSAAASVPFTVVAAMSNVVNLTLSGIPAELDVSPGARAVHGSQNGGLVLYGTTAQRFIVNARDVDGNIIVGAGSPTYAVSLVSGSGWTPAGPATTAPNTFMLTPPGINGNGAVFNVTASYTDSTCSTTGAVCTATFSVKNDLQTLFVGERNGSAVNAYAPPYTNGPTTTISSGVDDPIALGLDGADDLFVANFEGNTVTEYAPPYTGTPTTVATGIAEPRGVALDAAGDLFVANESNNNVTEYSPPYTGTPTTISDGLDGPDALVLDTSGDLFVSNYTNGTVDDFAPPYTGTPTVIMSETNPDALSLDAASDVFVGSEAASTVQDYAPPYTGAPTTVTRGVSEPNGLVLDAAGDLFVSNMEANTVTEYVPPYTGTPTTISNSIFSPVALALDAAGDLFVANESLNVTEYVPPYTGTPIEIPSGNVSDPDVLILTP